MEFIIGFLVAGLFFLIAYLKQGEKFDYQICSKYLSHDDLESPFTKEWIQNLDIVNIVEARHSIIVFYRYKNE